MISISDFVLRNIDSYALGVVLAVAIWIACGLNSRCEKIKDERILAMFHHCVHIALWLAGNTVCWMVYDICSTAMPGEAWLPYMFGTVQLQGIVTFIFLLKVLTEIVIFERKDNRIVNALFVGIAIDLAVFLITGRSWVWMVGVVIVATAFVLNVFVLRYKVNRYNALLVEAYVETDARDLSWVMSILYLVVILNATYIVCNIFSHSVVFDIIYNFLGVMAWAYMYMRLQAQNFDIKVVEEMVEEQVGELSVIGASDGGQGCDQASATYLADSRASEAIESYCREKTNFANPDISIGDIALAVGTNKTYVSRWFHSRDTNFSAYIMGLRLEDVAEQLINTNNNINDIATDSGFRSLPYFRTCFMERYGCSPREYRKKFSICSSNTPNK